MRTAITQRPARLGDVTTVIIGAGQAGLATAHHLDRLGIDHVILERGEVANSWRTERWDSLKLLSPNWQLRLPGCEYNGDDPEGFMATTELVEFFSHYAKGIVAPVHCNTTVTEVSPVGDGYRVRTTRGDWYCRAVVLASGAYNRPVVPGLDSALPPQIFRMTAHDYRNPQQLEEGGVLVVGASATGLQIASEVRTSGRDVSLCVGEHLRLPRRYRGKDILWWMDEVGLYGQRLDEVDDIKRVRATPSPQLVGSSDHRDLHLNSLRDQGVQMVGRLAGVRGNELQFSGGLANICKLADLKMQRLLSGIDDWIEATGFTAPDAEPFQPTDIPTAPLSLNLADGRIRTVIWACGFKPDYSWLSVPVLDRKGGLQHEGGVTPAAGLYAMGLPFMRRRNSSFIFGVADDAREIAEHLAQYVYGVEIGKVAGDWA